MIGALELSECFYELECLGKEEKLGECRKKTPAVLELYRSYKQSLTGYEGLKDRERTETEGSVIKATLKRLYKAMDVFDLDEADAAMKELEGYVLPAKLQPMAEELGMLPESEMKEIRGFYPLPGNLTYPDTTPVLIQEAENQRKCWNKRRTREKENIQIK